jgi:rare lipoprotein A
VSGRPIHGAATIYAAVCAALFMVMTTGCARKKITQVPAPPLSSPRIGATETGLASWYGAPYDGRRAASGEIYDMAQFTAAHRALPFGAWVEVTDLDNGKQVRVRITDRGPFVEGRVIDLSLAAARAIDMLGPGIARVRLKVIEAPVEEATERPLGYSYAVQAGAFSDPARADSFRNSLSALFEDTRVVESSALWHVLVGHQLTLDSANQLAAKVRRETGQAIVVPDKRRE